MTATSAIRNLVAEFDRLGIPPNRVEIVLAEADVEKIRKQAGKGSQSPTRSSVQRIAGVLVSGIATNADHSGIKVGDLA